MPQTLEVSTVETPALWKRVLGLVGTLAIAVFTLLAYACLTVQWILSFLVPLTPLDLSFASWRITPPVEGSAPVLIALLLIWTAMYFGFRGRTVGVFAALIGIGVSCGSIGPSLRSAILHGEAKVGCFDYQSTQCHSALGTLFGLPPAKKTAFALEELEAQQGSPLIGLIAIARAPFDLNRVAKLKELVNAQRAELATYLQGQPDTTASTK